jgi:phosphoribosylaminoimidazolecarboxamide formyltransferase/IMP cyclohydrolase
VEETWDLLPVRRALVSVSDKLGLVSFAEGLHRLGVELLATGGTKRVLDEAGIPSTEVSAYTGFPEILDGRVKTLHPNIFAGILARRDLPHHQQALEQLGIGLIDLVAVNLYPFERTVARPGCSLQEALEQIDIGGPALVRAAAKNFPYVVVVTDPDDYAEVLDELERLRGISSALRRRLAAKAFEMTAAYDEVIAAYVRQLSEPEGFPSTLVRRLQLVQGLRYGENPHQKGALYRLPGYGGPSIATGRQIHGRELSYNNVLDLDAALALVREFLEPAAVVVKHQNPCGVACALDIETAFLRAYEADPVSAYGCVLALNRTVSQRLAELIAAEGRFVEAIVAPFFDHDATAVLTTKPSWKKNVRLVEVGPLADREDPASPAHWEWRSVRGGALVQTPDVERDDPATWKVVTDRVPSNTEWQDLQFAWLVVKHVRSNAIVLARDLVTVGIGAGQTNRLDAVDVAVRHVGSKARQAVLASDAFFPFRDGIDRAAEAGVTAIIQPGGSKRDEECIAACNERGMAMVFTSRRHFRH